MIQTVSDGRLVGYARVSTDDQGLTLQIDALRERGVDAALIFTNKKTAVDQTSALSFVR